MPKNLAPIVLFTYNRPWHTQEVLNTLALNPEAPDSSLYIYCDGANPHSKKETLLKIEEVRQVVKNENRFKEVIIKEQTQNKGLAQSIIEGVTHLLNKYDKVIVLEDDLVTSPFFLKYMNDALNLYKDNDEVACISGYIYPIKKSLPETFFIKGADCWGWATWKDKWSLFEEDGQALLHELENKNLTKEFDFDNSYEYTEMLREQIQGKNSSWAIRWYASAFLKDKLCLYPGKSLIQNIGVDGSGTHSGISDNWKVLLSDKEIKVQLTKVSENSNARKLFIKYFLSLKHQKSPVRLKSLIKKVIKAPFNKKTVHTPVVQKEHGWFGNYSNWSDAKIKCTGYDDSDILEKVKNSVLKVKNGEAIYERDSVLFDEIQYSQPLLDAFKTIAKENNNELNIIDFGGSLGSSYFQNRSFLTDLKTFNWNIVEQPHFVDCGKQFIEGDQLKFYYNIEEALKENKPHILFLSSVIPYFEYPYELIEKCINYGFDYIIIDRTAFIESEKERITVQIVPEFIYKASYPAWFLNEQKFVNAFSSKYNLIGEFDSKFDPREQLEDGVWSYRKGFVFKKQ